MRSRGVNVPQPIRAHAGFSAFLFCCVCGESHAEVYGEKNMKYENTVPELMESHKLKR